MLSCVDIHWLDRILCKLIDSQWLDGLIAHVLGIHIDIDIGIAVNDSQQSNGISSDSIWSDSSQYTLSSWSSGIYKNQNWMCNERNLQWLIVWIIYNLLTF